MMIQSEIITAAKLLRQGRLVAFPTETVYGLGADASQPEALRRIFKAKQRPLDHPLIVHLADIQQLSIWAQEVSSQALRLAHAFWPGPLTLIFKKAAQVSDLVTGGQETIGLRIPSHPIAQALLKEFGGGVAAPSANRFGRISPTTAAAVREELGGAVDCILDGGQCTVGVESTILDVSGDQPVILRPGMITAQQIAAVLNEPVVSHPKNQVRVSGALESHYAPVTPTRLMTRENILRFVEKVAEKDLPIAIVSFSQTIRHPSIVSIEMPNDPKRYAHDFYQTLRELDKQQFKQIIIEKVPESPEWEAIQDRAGKASGRKDGLLSRLAGEGQG